MAGLLILAFLLCFGIVNSSGASNERKHQASPDGHGYTDRQPSTAPVLLGVVVVVVCCYLYVLGVHQ